MDYRAEIRRLQQLVDEQEREDREHADELWQQILDNPDNFEWRAAEVSILKENLLTRYANRPYVFLQKRLRPSMLHTWREWVAHVSVTKRYMDGQWRGMMYVLTDEGILTHKGAGTQLLDTPTLCSEDEWEELCEGRVPAKFIL